MPEELLKRLLLASVCSEIDLGILKSEQQVSLTSRGAFACRCRAITCCTAFAKCSFSKGNAEAGQFPFHRGIIPGARGSGVSRTKPLPFVLSLITRTDKPCSVPSFGLIPADGFCPRLEHRAQRRCRQRFPHHSRPQEYTWPVDSVPGTTRRLETCGLPSFV